MQEALSAFPGLTRNVPADDFVGITSILASELKTRPRRSWNILFPSSLKLAHQSKHHFRYTGRSGYAILRIDALRMAAYFPSLKLRQSAADGCAASRQGLGAVG
jgi:hypothetical protein